MEESKNQNSSNSFESQINYEELEKLSRVLAQFGTNPTSSSKNINKEHKSNEEILKEETPSKPKFERKIDKSIQLPQDRLVAMVTELNKLIQQVQRNMNITVMLGNNRIHYLPYREFLAEYEQNLKSFGENEPHELRRRVSKASPSLLKLAYLGNYVFSYYAILVSGRFISRISSSSSELYKICYTIASSMGQNSVSWSSMEICLLTILDNYESDNPEFYKDLMYSIIRLMAIYLHYQDIVASKILAEFILNQLELAK